MKNRTCIGIDPDSKDMAIAAWNDDGPVSAGVVHVSGSASNYQMIDALARERLVWPLGEVSTIAIEGQQRDGRKTGKGDLFKLAHMTGAVALWIRQQFPRARLLIPTPERWKGQLPKAVMQARLYDQFGWGYEMIGAGKPADYARPIVPPKHFHHITDGQWKHVGDALLLARWAYLQ